MVQDGVSIDSLGQLVTGYMVRDEKGKRTTIKTTVVGQSPIILDSETPEP